ncbi:MAG: AAC(3) family N-acetyltransferase [Prosthecobacter sp.]|nr:AAC(3) family N-acetyltransferase [Prosthecobacter sp.]
MSRNVHYTTQNIAEAYSQLGVQAGDVLYLTGNFGNLGFHESQNKKGTLQAHLKAIRAVIGDAGTLAVPTHSFSLCNTDSPFDVVATPSERGPFTEYIRQIPGTVRQLHPFASITALGAAAEEICSNTARHAYGPNTPFHRLLQQDAWFISVSMPPERTCSIVHHVEQAMAVPYRYTKEFLHPIQRGDNITIEPFYLYVTYRDVDLVRDRNEKIFQHPLLRDHVKKIPLGLGHLWAYRLRIFEQAARDALTQDIYAWLRQPPVKRPYQR